MNARMSRLRRSLSRSVHQLSMSRSNSLNGLIELPTSSYTTLVDRFAEDMILSHDLSEYSSLTTHGFSGLYWLIKHPGKAMGTT
ncbi:hypothetical protein ANCCEY_07826 [Ancylostoma ceylanicum]|uniref:Uncharacterized protein n=1 Tax=Ancylostoma ceylanicum TaxID=53326 RepID=A0A0D6LPE0_9BILA|nr:hypothetical protein ANCCEY_07826 [Ancylostoma ceylanicum]